MNKILRFLGFGFTVIFMEHATSACSCPQPAPKVTEAESILGGLRMAKSVFVGTAIANDKKTSAFTFMGPLRNLFRREGDFIHVATFRVETNIKNAASREIRITTGRFGGFKADIGESVLVYAFGDKELETSICWIRRLQGAREELKVLLNGAAQPAAAADR